MSAVDERVVRMEFDNKQFEQNIKQSIKSLDDLDKQLGLVGEEDAFDNIDKSSKKIDFSHLLGGVSKITDGFSALEAIALGALTRIGSKLTDVISKYAGFFTVKQIGAGWQKFADYSTATQTTLAATAGTWEKEAADLARIDYLTEQIGDRANAKALNEVFNEYQKGGVKIGTLAKELGMSKDELSAVFNEIKGVQNTLSHEEFVERAVEQLNWYSDETSYNFTDMISTLGKFTGAGQELMKSTDAIQGMMNMVAVAGGNAEVGQRVAYNLSQAMGAGYLKMIDWKSLQNANVATVAFKDHLLETAAAMGVIDKTTTKSGETVYKYGKETFSATSNFESSLAKGWATSAVLQATLEDYGKFTTALYDFTSEYGYTATESLGLINDYYETLGEGANQNKVLEWQERMKKEFSGDEEAIAAFEESLKSLGSEEMKFSRDAFKEAQAAKTFKDSIDATADAVSTKWANIFKYMFGNSEKAKAFWSNFTETLYDIFAAPLDGILDIFAAVENGTRIMMPGVEGTVSAFDVFRMSLNNLQEALLSIINPIREVFNEIFMTGAAEKINTVAIRFFNFTKSLILGTDGTEKFKNALTGFFKIIKGITGIVGSVFKIIKPIFGLVSPIIRLIGTLASKIGLVISAFANVTDSNAGAVVNGIAKTVSSAVEWITKQLDNLTNWINKNINFNNLANVFNTVKSVFVTAWNAIKTAAINAWGAISQYLPTFEEISGFVASIWDTVKQFLPTWEDIIAGLQEGWQWFKNIADVVWKFVQPYFQQLGNSLKTFWGKLSGFITGFIEADDKLQYLKDNLFGIIDTFLEWKRNSKFLKWVVQQFENVKKVVQDIKEALKPKEGGTGAGSFFGILYLVASLTALFVIMRNVSKISTGFKNLTQAVKRFSTAIKRVVTFVGLYLVVEALTALINALTGFAQLNPKQIWNSIAAVIVLGAGLLGFAAMMKKITKEMSEGDIKSFRKVTTTLAIVLLAIAGSMWILSKSSGLTWEPLMLIGMLAAIVIAAYALSTYVGDVKTNTLLTLVVIAAVILVAAYAIEKIAKLDAVQFEQAKNIILILAGVALAAMIIGAVLNKGSDTMKNIAIAVGIMAASLLIIVLALNKLQTIKMSLGMVGILVGVLAVLAILAVIPVYMAKFARERMITGRDMTKMATTIGIMALSLLAIVLALGFLAKAMSKAGLSSGDMLALSGVVLAIGITLGVMALALAGATKISGNSDSKFKDMKKMAKAVRSMVVSLLLIIAAIAVMTKLGMTVESASEAINIIFIVSVILGLLTVALAGASRLAGKNKSGESNFKSGPIIAMVLGIVALVGTLMVLTKFIEKNGDNIGKAAIVMGGIALILGVMAILMGSATAVAGEKGLQWGAIAVMMLGIMGVAHMMILMSAVPADQLKTVGIVLGVIIIAIGLMALAIGAMNKMSEGSSALKSIGMIIAISIALVAAAIAFSMLKDVDSESLLNSATAIAGVIAVIGILGAVMGSVGGMAAVGVLAIAGAILIVSAAFLIVAVAANIAAAALPILSEGIVMLGDAMESISATPGQVFALCAALLFLGVFGTIAMIGIGVGALFMAGAFYIGVTALSILAGILPQLTTGLVMLVTALAAMNSVGGAAVGTAFMIMAAFLGLMFAGIFAGIGLAAAGAGLGVVALAAMGLATAILIASLGVSTFVASLALLAQGVALVADIFKGGNLSAQVSGFADSVKSGTDNITQSVSELQTAMSGAGGGGEGGGGFLEGLFGSAEGGTPDFVSMLGLSGEGGLKDQLTGFFSEGGGMGDFDLMGMLTGGAEGEGGLFGGMDFGGDITNMLSGGIGDIDTSKLSGAFGDKLSGIFDMESMGIDVDFGQSLMSGITATDLGPAGEESADSFVKGVDSKKGAAKSSGQSLSKSGSSGASSANGGWVTAGSNGAQGLVNGIKSKLSSAEGAGRELAEAAYKAAMKYLQEKSPSRLFMQTGEYVSEGFAIGITDGIPYAVSSVKDMAMSTVGAASEILAAAIENDYTNPVIRPTLDLSNVAAGAASINSMFGRQSVGVDGEAGSASSSAAGTTYNYVQNNYSPKALNRIEIYRQTKNQINASSVMAKV